jgi:hypothetical protein
MAFHVDEKRDLDMRLGDKQIDTAPGMYDILDHKSKKNFNVQEVPFNSRAERKVFEVNPDTVNEPNGDPLWDYINIIREEKFRYFKSRLLHKGKAFDFNTGRNPNENMHYAKSKRSKNLNASLNHKGLNFPGTKNENANVGPGMYYKDPMAERLKKIRMKEKAKKLVKQRKLE